jgi:murein DD-endopeptidase MepM/ murein hydrolase activator NlpD
MKNLLLFIVLAAVLSTGCSSKNVPFFSKKTPLEKYEEKLEDSGLEKTPEGRQWLAASQSALQHPQTVQLPYRQIGIFPTDKPRALGLQFTAKRGERLMFNLQKETTDNFVLYAELFRQDATGGTQLLLAEDTNTSEFIYDIGETGPYILKLQPQLSRVGSYNLSIAVGPSLSLPVAGNKASIGSFWGADRDGGKRSHEGIDIFAPKRTPAVAAADGFIVGVREGGLGGKTVWLRPEGKAITLYYAHLDEQLVREGQTVKKGDTVGLVGNTGNAQHTPSHLHFGVYGLGGAVDPLPFVSQQVKTAPSLPGKKMAESIRLVKDYKMNNAVIAKNTRFIPIALNAKGYIAEGPDGQLRQLSTSIVQSEKESSKGIKGA